MSRMVQAYFHTENEAEDVRIRLQGYKVENIEIGALPEALDRNTPLLIPIAFAGSTAGGPVGGYAGGSTGTGATAGDASAAGAYIGLRELDAERHDHDHDGVDDRELRYSLSVQVQEADYGAVVDLIRRNRGHVQKDPDDELER